MTSPTNPQPDEIERAKGGSYFQAMAEANAEIIRLREQIAAKDAERRMRAIRLNGRVAGWPCYSHSTNTLTLPFVAAWAFLTCSFRNLFGRKT
jgi:hypothetical protein